MPDIRRCSIYGCRSNSRENRDLKFFNFPVRDSPFYAMWLSLCEESAESISAQRRPYICSKHFHKKDVGFRRLAAGALPALFLTAPPGFAEEESARMAEMAAEQSEKIRMVNLVNETVLEWVRRAQHYAATADICSTRRELRRVAERVRNLLGATLLLSVDDYWLRKFRRSHMLLLMHEDSKNSRNKSLDLEEIISDIDPNATILSEDEIAFLIKKEKTRQTEIEEKRSIARAMKKTGSDQPLVVGVHSKKYKASGKKNASETSFGEHSNLSSDLREDDSMSSECYEVKSESDSNSMNDDEEGDDLLLEDLEDNCMDEDQPSKPGEIVINSYEQALQHLKPLEDFALKQENYRAIGLLSTLEIIFKNPKNNP